LAFLSFLMAVLVTAAVVSAKANSTEFDETASNTAMSGVFYNLLAMAGGIVDVDLALTDMQALGYINFTQRPEDPAPLCGAGDFSGPRDGNTLHLSFISDDPDPGCGFDRNAVFTMTANIDGHTTHFWGDYQGTNAGGSHIREAPGVFEAWTPGSQPRRA
jgi:hypothetical protein